MNFLYVNNAEYQGRNICKIGISNNPRKRLTEFNNGMRHRYAGRTIKEPVIFNEFFVVKIAGRKSCQEIERHILKTFAKKKLLDFGREVFDAAAEDAAQFLNRYVRLNDA